jgi:hypothetical protein
MRNLWIFMTEKMYRDIDPFGGMGEGGRAVYFGKDYGISGFLSGPALALEWQNYEKEGNSAYSGI